MPGSGLFEMAAAAAATLLDGSSEAASLMALTGITIPLPLLLQTAGRTLVETVVDCGAGNVEVSTPAGGKGPRQLHCRAFVQQLQPVGEGAIFMKQAASNVRIACNRGPSVLHY